MGDLIKFGCGSIVGLLVGLPAAIVVFVAVLGAGSGSASPARKAAMQARFMEREAAQHLQKIVTPLLKSPSTAKFPSIVDWYSKETTEKGTYLVSSHVDSQNGFGAMIRTTFKATLKKAEGGWKVDSLEMNRGA